MASASVIGRFFRRLADFFDRLPAGRNLAATLTEVSVIAGLLTAVGIVALGTAIHGWHTIGWLIFYAAEFTAGSWLVFSAGRWGAPRRNFLFACILLLAIPVATERLLAITIFVPVVLWLCVLLLRRTEQHSDWTSVAIVLLFCYVSYSAFSATMQWRRNSSIAMENSLALECGYHGKPQLRCEAGETGFEVPEFWKAARAAHISADLEGIADMKIFADTATDNSIAFAAFSSPPGRIVQELGSFFTVQKAFLHSKAATGAAIVPQLIMKSLDAELYALSYRSPATPGYLGTLTERNAILLLHQPHLSEPEGRSTTWLFIIDGSDLLAREFLLHRIVSGFRRPRHDR